MAQKGSFGEGLEISCLVPFMSFAEPESFPNGTSRMHRSLLMTALQLPTLLA